MTNLSIFAFEGKQVRFVGTLEAPEWIAADVCNILELNASEAVNGRKNRPNSGLDEDEKGIVIVNTLGGEQEMLTVTEPGLYRLLSKSRKAIAKRFQRWLFHEVLPSIRKTGSYSLPSAEVELKQLELQIIQAKQHYQDTGYAIALSTSPAMLAWYRGDTPPPPQVKYLDRFVDARSGREVGSASGRSLTQLISDAGLNPKSKRDKDRVKRALKRYGFDYDRMENWSEASYLRKHPVLKDEVYDQALKAVLGEVMTGESNQNLFVHQMQQGSLNPQKQPRGLQGVEQP
jgi:prophage antirepressor-like protein